MGSPNFYPRSGNNPALSQRAAVILAAAAMVFGSGAGRAGDILRGGAPANAPRPQHSFGIGPAETARARNNARDAIARTSQALNAVEERAGRGTGGGRGARQRPGRRLPQVSDGLKPGGLQFINATGADPPTQSGNTVTVRQTAQQALLSWTTFNVGRSTTLFFDQSAGGANVSQWIAFNKVEDPSGAPSQILGSIHAAGQVYVINQNGIIFGGASQVNVHALVASSLPINENLVTRGLLNNPDAQFLFSALAQPAGAKGRRTAFTPPPPPPGGKIRRCRRAARRAAHRAHHGRRRSAAASLSSAPTSPTRAPSRRRMARRSWRPVSRSASMPTGPTTRVCADWTFMSARSRIRLSRDRSMRGPQPTWGGSKPRGAAWSWPASR